VTSSVPQLPICPAGGVTPTYINQLVAALQRAFYATSSPSGAGTYQVSGVTPNRTFNASTASTAEVAQTLGTLLQDLQAGQVIGG